MSFILDALKKLEEQRRNDASPDLMTVHVEEKEVKSRPLLMYFLAAILLLNAVIFTAWLLRLQPQNSDVQTARTETEQVNVPETGSMAGPAPGEKEKAVEEAPVKKAKEEPLPVTAEAEAPAVEQAPLPLTPSPEELRKLKSTIAGERLTANAEPAPGPEPEDDIAPDRENIAPDMDPLSSAAIDALPDLEIKAHIYSNDPDSRLVNINGNILHEGETVTEGLKVNEITMSGVVFDYNGLLFSVRAF